jgi:hypothetical protein
VAWHAAGGGANGIGVATIHESAIWGMETLLTAVSAAGFSLKNAVPSTWCVLLVDDTQQHSS